MDEICESCRMVFQIMQRYIGSADFKERPLDHEDVILLIQWIRHSTEFKSTCRCIYKDTELFWSLLKILRKLYDVASTLIENLNEFYSHMSEMKQIVAENSSESNESMDEDEYDSNGYTLRDQSQLFETCAHLLVDNFSLYIAYQRNLSHAPAQMIDRHVKMKKFLNSTQIAPPVLFMFDAVMESNILHNILVCLSKRFSKPLLPPDIVLKMFFIVFTVKNHASDLLLKRFIWPIRDLMLKYLCEIADSQGDLLRENSIRQLSDNLWNMSRDFATENYNFDNTGLILAVKHLNSPFLAPRLAGLHQINNIINCTSDTAPDEITETLASLLQNHEIVQTVFGPNLHMELIKQAHSLLSFLAVRQKLSKRDLDCIWASSHIKHCGRQVLDLLTLVVKHLDPELIIYLYSLLKTLKPSEHSDMTLHLTSKVTKSIWQFLSLRNTHQQLRMEDSSFALSPDKHKTVLLKKSPTSGNYSVKEPEDGEGDCKLLPKIDDSLVQEIVHVGGGDLSDEQQHCVLVEKAHSTVSSSSSPPPLTSGSENVAVVAVVAVATSTPLKRTSDQCQQHEQQLTTDSVEFSPVNKRQKVNNNLLDSQNVDNVLLMQQQEQQRPMSAKLAEMRGLEISVDEDGGFKPHTPPTHFIPTASWDSQIEESEEEGSSSGSLEDEEHVQTLSKFIVKPTGGTNERRRSPLPFGNRPVLVEGRPGMSGLSSNRLLENLVKNKPQIRGDRSGMELSDSEVSSDAATSSDRLGDFDDEDMMKHSCSPANVDEEDEEAMLEAELEEGLPRAHRSYVSVSRYQLMQRKFVPDMSSSSSSHVISWSIRSEADALDAFDLMKLCEPRQTLLWDLIQDDLYEERVSLENENLILHLLEELSVYQPIISRQFIQGCIENLRNRRSTLVSVKLLSKLLSHSRNFGPGSHMHPVLWCDESFDFINAVIDDLAYYRRSDNKSNRYGNDTEIKVRLTLLDYVYSYTSTPKTFVLKQSQLDVLWDCLSTDQFGRECLYTWLYEQLKLSSKHAINKDLLLYILQTKANSFDAATLSNTGLSLLHTFLWCLRDDGPDGASAVLQLLWQVALRNVDTNVGMTAMKFVSDYYVDSGGSKCKEKEFIDWCMEHLRSACSTMDENLQSSLMIIHRALNLLHSHIDSFKKRFSFHLRLWDLENRGITSHGKVVQQSLPECSSNFKVYLQIGSNNTEKTPLFLNYSDTVSQLRAEVYHWWQTRRLVGQSQSIDKQPQQQRRTAKVESQNLTPTGIIISGDASTLFSSATVNKSSLRLLTAGHELTPEMDEKMVLDVNLKEGCTIIVCQSSKTSGSISSRLGGSGDLPASITGLASPDPDLTPMKLLGESYLQLLMNLTEKLHNCAQNQDSEIAFRSRTYCMRAWEVIQSLPTLPTYLTNLKDICSLSEGEVSREICRQKWESYFQPSRMHSFLYALQVLESNLGQYKEQFLKFGGIDFITDTLFSRSPFAEIGRAWDQWAVECVTSMLRIIYTVITPNVAQLQLSQQERRHFVLSHKRHTSINRPPEIIFYPVDLHPFSSISAKDIVKILINIVSELTSERVDDFCTVLARVQGVNCCLQLLISLLYSSDEFETAFLNNDLINLTQFLNDTLLDCGDITLRHEISNGLYRLCRGKRGTDGSALGRHFVIRLVNELLANLDKAQKLAPPKREETEERSKDLVEGKDSFGLSPFNYFYLLTSLIDFLREEFIHSEISINFDEVCAKTFDYMEQRPIYEIRDSGQTDHGLQGLIQFACSLVKFNLSWKASHGLRAIGLLFDMIFSTPTKVSNKPKCKSQNCRTAGFDLLVELAKAFEHGYNEIHKLLMKQNSKESHDSYPWDYWPSDERRAPCGFVGVTNLGATCYMATAVQHLFMLPKFRTVVLNADASQAKDHEPALRELQRMFTFLLLSERKAYIPRSFCKAYLMNHQPLNITEQKDMNEFFTDLVTKVDDMSPEFKKLVKNLFGGVMSNNVVSLDCQHVSKTTEIFYSVRCAVADMKNLYDSLNSLTVVDMLEGDNMYTCSQCNKKVRAEKRACFKQLPKVLCFNTMRYTFNMITMMKEKVNTHFSFPMRLNMSAYMEENLLPNHANDDAGNETSTPPNVSYEYELIGVTVHTGTAEGGHYYCFINDKNNPTSNNWYSFNDAEVRPWDPSNMDAECFGGELTKQQYDNVTDKYLDLSYEKTNSAYMLFYERLPLKDSLSASSTVQQQKLSPTIDSNANFRSILSNGINLSEELETWIYDDNRRFIQDLMFFDHSYTNFVWQICSQVPQSLVDTNPSELTLLTAKLSLSFVLETLIHSKEKPTLTSWTELLLKDLSSSPKACEWFLEHAAKHSDWLTEILIASPSKVNREMFQKLCLHAILQLQIRHEPGYLLPWQEGQSYDLVDLSTVGQSSCVTQFIRQMLNLICPSGPNLDTRQLNEYFTLIYEFGRSSKVALKFLQLHSVISIIVQFYITKSSQEKLMELGSEDESDEDSSNNILSLVRNACGLRSLTWTSAVLDKIVKILMLLLDAQQKYGNDMRLLQSDWVALVSQTKPQRTYPYYFLMQLIKDCNSNLVCGPLVLSLCSMTPKLTPKIIEAIFERLHKTKDDVAESYFNILNHIMEHSNNEDESSCIINLIIEYVWQLTKGNRPLLALKWFETNIQCRKEVLNSLKKNLPYWTDKFLFSHNAYNVRSAAADLLIACIHQSMTIRAVYNQICQKHLVLTPRQPISHEATKSLHDIFEFLLSLLPKACEFADPDVSTHRLVSYFNVLKACLFSRDEKLMVVQHFNDLWKMYRVHMCEKQVKIHANKQSVLTFWYMASYDCPEMVAVATRHGEVMQHFMYTYIFTQNDDELIEHNKKMLHAFYGLMKLFCSHSDKFAEIVLAHENLDFACKSVTIADHYSNARDEIFGAIEICFRKIANQKEKLKKYREKVFDIYLKLCSATNTNFTVLLKFFKLVESEEDKIYLLQKHILNILSDNFFALHAMHHNATGCYVVPDLVEILKRFSDILKLLSAYKESKDQEKENFANDVINQWSNMNSACTRMMELMNSYNPPDVRKSCMECVKKISMFGDADCLRQILALINQVHSNIKTSGGSPSIGPYFPRRGQVTSTTPQHLRRVHPPHPMLNMCLNSMQLEAAKGVDTAYDQGLYDYFSPYHVFVDRLLRCACNLGSDSVPAQLIAEVSCLLGAESVPLHFAYFPKFWLDVSERLKEGKDVQDRVDALKNCDYLREYIDVVFTMEQSCLSIHHIHSFVRSVVEDLAPEVVIPDTKRPALENAVSVLSQSTKFAENEFDRLPLILTHYIGALRILSLLCDSVEIAEQLKRLDFWSKLEPWLANVSHVVDERSQLASSLSSQPASSSVNPISDVTVEKDTETCQQSARYLIVMKDQLAELHSKITEFDEDFEAVSVITTVTDNDAV